MDYGTTYATPRVDQAEALFEYRRENPERDFAGSMILPVLRRGRKDGAFSVITRGTLNQNPDTKRTARGAYNRITVQAKDDTYKCVNYGLEGPVDESERIHHESDFDLTFVTTLAVWRAVMIAQEIRTAAKVFDTARWTGAAYFTDHSGSPWTTSATDVIGQIIDAKDKVADQIGEEPNALIISRSNLSALLKNTAILGRFPGHSGPITLAMLQAAMASVFGLEKLIVGRGTYNAAPANEDPDVPGTLTQIWSSSYAMVAKVCDEGAAQNEGCLGRTVLWEDYSPELWTVESYEEAQTEAEIIKVKNHIDLKLHDKAFGHLLQVR